MMMHQQTLLPSAKPSRPSRLAVCRPVSRPTVVKVRAAHASVAPPALSNYPPHKLSGPQSGHASWLPTAMPRIVQQVSMTGRPVLQLIYTRPHLHFQTLALPAAIANEPERWADINQYVKDAQADGLVLVRPVPSPSAAVCPCQSSSDCCGGAASSALAVTASSPSTVDLEGKVGLCCAGDDAHHLEEDTHHHTSAKSKGKGKKPAGGPASPAAAGSSGLESMQEAYYGVVVQSKSEVPTSEDGCYLLKATRNADLHGCSCTHYSMVHVCSGQPLYQQLRESWLA